MEVIGVWNIHPTGEESVNTGARAIPHSFAPAVRIEPN
jgi:hypothetical protein